MRVLHCIWRMGIGGAERQLVYLTRGLRRLDVDVHAATVLPGENDQPLVAAGAVPHQVPSLGKFDPFLVPRLVALTRKLRPDVMSTWLTQMDILGGLAAKMTGVPWLLCERSVAAAYPPSVRHAARRWIGRHADAIVANSEEGRDYWTQWVDAERVYVIPNAVPLREMESAFADEETSTNGQEVILYVGRFVAEKNLDRLLDALTIALPQTPARVVLCGDGPLRSAMERRAADLGIADQLLFLGTVSNVWAWMRRAAVVVSVSIFEGNPNAVLEAMGCGVPLVVSDIPSHRALLSGDTARFVDPHSAQSIATGLLEVLAARTEAHGRAQKARTAVGSLSVEETAASYARVYERLARGQT